MDVVKFEAILADLEPASLQQEPSEWRAFLEFVDAYLRNRGIEKPLVLEIGTYNNLQRRFYTELLGAEHIGLDIKVQPGRTPPDILGDSHALETAGRLKAFLDGRWPDLVFIDAAHTFADVSADYAVYAPFARHLVALHDIYTAKLRPSDSIGTIEFWRDIVVQNKTDTLIEFRHFNPREGAGVFNPGRQMGIGLIIKKSP